MVAVDLAALPDFVDGRGEGLFGHAHQARAGLVLQQSQQHAFTCQMRVAARLAIGVCRVEDFDGVGGRLNLFRRRRLAGDVSQCLIEN